jgi:hypothetical protein
VIDRWIRSAGEKGEKLPNEFSKEDPDIRAAHEWMLRQFDEGRQTAVEWEEIASFLGTQT